MRDLNGPRCCRHVFVAMASSSFQTVLWAILTPMNVEYPCHFDSKEAAAIVA